MANTQERIIGERQKTGIYEFLVGDNVFDWEKYIPDKVESYYDVPVSRKVNNVMDGSISD